MDIQASSLEDLFEGLPGVIGLPGCLPARPQYRRTPLAEVCVPEELPPYLLLGALDRHAFRSSDGEWVARWQGGDAATCVEARCDRLTQQLTLRQVWRGIEGGTGVAPAVDFGRAIQMLYLPFPEAWDLALAARLESAYRLRYWPARKEQFGLTGIPDGEFKMIGVPVPIARLGTIHDCLAQLSSDREVTVPAGGRLELRLSAVNYVTGGGPRWTEAPDLLAAVSFEASGLLPLGMPQLERADNGTSAWTVRRLVYLAFIQVPFAGVELFVERLAQHGLIRRRTVDGPDEPGVEFDAFAGPSALDLQGRTVAWMDAQGARRVFYRLNSEEELAKGGVDRMTEASAQSEEEARELIRQAVLVSVRQRNWLAGFATCEECES